MIIRCETPNPQAPSIVVRFKAGDEVECVYDTTGVGVEVPDGAPLASIDTYGSRAMTQQIVFLSAWPVEEAA